jgi:hypothetical protein
MNNALLVIMMAAGAGLNAPPAASANALSLGGARLGMTLEAWRALPFPGRTGDHLNRVCDPWSRTSMAASLRDKAATTRFGTAVMASRRRCPCRQDIAPAIRITSLSAVNLPASPIGPPSMASVA